MESNGEVAPPGPRDVASDDPGSSAAPVPDAGWYPDPHGAPTLRWWDGATWSTHVHADGVTVDEGQQPLKVLEWLTREPEIWFHELEPGRYGGRIDLVSTDGRFLGTAGSNAPTTSWGWMGSTVDIHLHAANGLLLASMRREAGARNTTHRVIDSSGTLMGAFVKRSAFSNSVEIETGAGVIGRVNASKSDIWLQSASGASLVRLQRMSALRLFKASKDTYCLRVLAPLPPWLLVFALLLPIEVDMRVADQRNNSRSNASF